MSGILSGGLGRILAQRLLQALVVSLLVAALCFLIVQQLPGDMAFRIAAGRYGYDYVNAAAAESVRQELGLHLPAWQQFVQWLQQLASGDLGQSLVTGAAVIDDIALQLGATIQLSLVAMALSLLLGLPLGIASGLHPGRWPDRLVLGWSVAMRALPPFLLGLVLMLGLAVQLGWLPVAGHGEEESIILPALTLGLGLSGLMARIVRDSVVRVVQSDYYRFALTKGLSPRTVFWRHGLRNIGVTVVSYASVQLILLIEGVVVVESLFAWPGIGHALVHAIFWRDVPMIQGCTLVLAWLFVLMNTATDVLCLAIDPRGPAE